MNDYTQELNTIIDQLSGINQKLVAINSSIQSEGDQINQIWQSYTSGDIQREEQVTKLYTGEILITMAVAIILIYHFITRSMR